MDDDLDEVRIVEGRRSARKRGFAELPVRRPHAPQQPGDLAPVPREPSPAPLAVEIILVPERGFRLGRRRLQGAGDVLDVVGIATDKRLRALGPKRGHDAGRAPAPVVAAENRALDFERVEKRQEVGAERRLLARARRRLAQKSRRPEAAQVWHDDPRPGFRQDRRDLGIGARIVRKAVAHHARPAVGGAESARGNPEHGGVGKYGKSKTLTGKPAGQSRGARSCRARRATPYETACSSVRYPIPTP